jgi:hypothetical protein
MKIYEKNKIKSIQQLEIVDKNRFLTKSVSFLKSMMSA